MKRTGASIGGALDYEGVVFPYWRVNKVVKKSQISKNRKKIPMMVKTNSKSYDSLRLMNKH